MVPDLAMILLSVPALVRKNIGVMFLLGKTMLIDLEDNEAIPGDASQDKDGLSYIPYDAFNRRSIKYKEKQVKAMISITSEHH